jgi:hypothetical protein
MVVCGYPLVSHLNQSRKASVISAAALLQNIFAKPPSHAESPEESRTLYFRCPLYSEIHHTHPRPLIFSRNLGSGLRLTFTMKSRSADGTQSALSREKVPVVMRPLICVIGTFRIGHCGSATCSRI